MRQSDSARNASAACCHQLRNLPDTGRSSSARCGRPQAARPAPRPRDEHRCGRRNGSCAVSPASPRRGAIRAGRDRFVRQTQHRTLCRPAALLPGSRYSRPSSVSCRFPRHARELPRFVLDSAPAGRARNPAKPYRDLIQPSPQYWKGFERGQCCRCNCQPASEPCPRRSA